MPPLRLLQQQHTTFLLTLLSAAAAEHSSRQDHSAQQHLLFLTRRYTWTQPQQLQMQPQQQQQQSQPPSPLPPWPLLLCFLLAAHNLTSSSAPAAQLLSFFYFQQQAAPGQQQHLARAQAHLSSSSSFSFPLLPARSLSMPHLPRAQPLASATPPAQRPTAMASACCASQRLLAAPPRARARARTPSPRSASPGLLHAPTAPSSPDPVRTRAHHARALLARAARRRHPRTAPSQPPPRIHAESSSWTPRPDPPTAQLRPDPPPSFTSPPPPSLAAVGFAHSHLRRRRGERLQPSSDTML